MELFSGVEKRVFFFLGQIQRHKSIYSNYIPHRIVGNLRLNLCYAMSIKCMDYLLFFCARNYDNLIIMYLKKAILATFHSMLQDLF